MLFKVFIPFWFQFCSLFGYRPGCKQVPLYI